MLLRCLLAVPNALLRRGLAESLRSADVVVSRLGAREDLFERLGEEGADLVVLSPDVADSPIAETIRRIRMAPEQPDVLVLGADDAPQQRAELLAAGALAVLDARISQTALSRAVRTLVERRQVEGNLHAAQTAQGDSYRLSDFASDSPAMQHFLAVVRRVVPSDSNLLVLGETGVGKEWLSRAIHAEGPRAQGPFLAVNCAALPEPLLESELFGHERGAFTGAVRAHRGAFELAHRGTILLDEIGEIPTHLQAKLLRAIQDRQVTRVGGERPVRVDVRVMAATNRDLEEEVRARRFRADLFYRLGVVALIVPPLRERREDIPALVEGAIGATATRLPSQAMDVDPDALSALIAYDWPGNVRELLNVIERAMLLSAAETITIDDLPPAVARAVRPGGSQPRVAVRDAGGQGGFAPWRVVRERALAEAERSYLVRLLEHTRGRVGEAAEIAGMSPRSLYGKLRAHRLEKKAFRRPGAPSPPPAEPAPAASGSAPPSSPAGRA